jgi:hypothetical protein
MRRCCAPRTSVRKRPEQHLSGPAAWTGRRPRIICAMFKCPLQCGRTASRAAQRRLKVKPLPGAPRAPHTLVMLCATGTPRFLGARCSMPTARWRSQPPWPKTAHRDLSVLCNTASAPTRSQALIASAKTARCVTIARRTPLLPRWRLSRPEYRRSHSTRPESFRHGMAFTVAQAKLQTTVLEVSRSQRLKGYCPFPVPLGSRSS